MSFTLKLCLYLWLSVAPAAAIAGNDVFEQRQAFLQAESYIRQGRTDDFFAIAEALKGYVLYPYLQYQWLSEHPEDQKAVQQFLADYADSRYASLLHEKWMLFLGKSDQWQTLLNNYRGSDDKALQCYVATAQYLSGQGEAARFAARALWLEGKALPDNCEQLFGEKLLNFYSDHELVWQRFQRALSRDQVDLALALQGKLPQAEAELWLKLHRQPNLVAEFQILGNASVHSPALFAHAIRRWIDKEPQAAARVWDVERSNPTLPAELKADIDKQLAIALALKHDASAYERLAALPNNDHTSLEWRVRAAIYEQNWLRVTAAIADLPEELRNSDKWRYWAGRALAELGQKVKSMTHYEKASQERSLYGFLAAERLNKAVELRHEPVPVNESDIQALQQSGAFLAVAELLALGRKTEAKRQWRFAVNRLKDKDQLVAAAKLAQRWNCPALAIMTIARTGFWGDLDLRYPLNYVDSVARHAGVDPAVVLGVIRQESAFDEVAESSAGAKGLMQLMPATAKEVAVEAKVPWDGNSALFDPQRNILLGSHYFQKLLQRFGGRYLPAAAAYNAGPKRVGQWLPEHGSMAGDVWLETIPYKETRSYVTAVIGNSIIYHQRLNRQGIKALDLVGEISPG